MENDLPLVLGILGLHCWVKCLGFILHLSYKMEIKNYKSKTIEQKLPVNLRKKEIQLHFREQLSLSVDMPKAGFSNSNCGNTAKRALKIMKSFLKLLMLIVI